jgi:hypothetical protein
VTDKPQVFHYPASEREHSHHRGAVENQISRMLTNMQEDPDIAFGAPEDDTENGQANANPGGDAAGTAGRENVPSPQPQAYPEGCVSAISTSACSGRMRC